MLPQLVTGLRLLAELLVLPLLCGAGTLWATARYLRRPAGAGRLVLAAAVCAAVYGAGVLAGAWHDGALLAYTVLVVTAALCAAVLLRR